MLLLDFGLQITVTFSTPTPVNNNYPSRIPKIVLSFSPLRSDPSVLRTSLDELASPSSSRRDTNVEQEIDGHLQSSTHIPHCCLGQPSRLGPDIQGTALDGYNPVSPLTVDGAGNLYGAAYYGGLYYGGEAYEITPP
jgi:hypothetical protein